MQNGRFPPNMYGFKSSILGIAPERLIILAAFVFIAFLLYRSFPVAAISILMFAAFVTLYRRGEKHLLIRLAGWVSWKLSRKSFIPDLKASVQKGALTVVTEDGKHGLIVRLKTDEIYDLLEENVNPLFDSVRRILNSINGVMKVFVVPMDRGIYAKPISTEFAGASEYNQMVSQSLSAARYHRVYLLLFNEKGSGSSGLADLEKRVAAVISLFEASGFAAETEVEGEEIESLYLHSI